MTVKSSPIKILVTGASGFLGNAIVQTLLSRSPPAEITTLDVRPLRPGTAESIGKRHFIIDLTSSESVEQVFVDYQPDIVVHSAGIVPDRDLRYSTSSHEWDKVLAINYGGTKNILDASMKAGCRRFVYTSSCTVIIDDVDTDYRNMDETLPLGRATLFYGKSKAMAEQYVLSSSHTEKGLKACALRPSTIIGPGDLQVISVLHDCIRNGETHFIVGDGDNIYDWMYIDNAVYAHLLAVENLLGETQEAAGHAFHISNQEPVYFWDFLLYVWAQFGHVPRYRFRIPHSVAWVAGAVAEKVSWLRGTGSTLSRGSVKDGIRTHYANNEKARRVLGYLPQVSMAEGVRRSCEAYKQHLAEQSATRDQTMQLDKKKA